MADPDKKSDIFGLLALNDFRKKSGFTCSFMIFAALNLAMLIIGAENLDECPITHMIPVYLIVAGTTSLLLLVSRLFLSHIIIPQLQKAAGGGNRVGAADEESSISESVTDKQNLSLMMFKLIKVFDSLASIFSTCWMIVGSAYVYGKWTVVTWNPDAIDPDVSRDDPIFIKNYCDYTTYMFAFVVITIGYVSLFFSLLGAICTCFCKGADADE